MEKLVADAGARLIERDSGTQQPMSASAKHLTHNIMNITVAVTSLGFFIDMFDMFLFNMLRVKSLTDLGFSGQALTQTGLFISNCQFSGFLIGAYVSGILADKFGRKSSLFLCIIVYSIGSLASACVQNAEGYAVSRFITGLGLAGELGAGITLIVESLKAERRGYGAGIFCIFGLAGVIVASLVTEFIPWRMAYILGGFMGLMILLTRVMVAESFLYQDMAQKIQKRGGLRLIFKDRQRLKIYICAILIMVPAVFTPQILWTLSPEIASAMSIAETVKPNIIIGIGFSAAISGELMAIFLSEYLGSRKKSALCFLILGSVVFLKYCLMPPQSLFEFYAMNALLGLSFGCWVMGCIWAAEHFSTNIRGTTAITIPNFARALTLPMNMLYGSLKVFGPINAVFIIGIIVFALAWLGWRGLSETYGKDLQYAEI